MKRPWWDRARTILGTIPRLREETVALRYLAVLEEAAATPPPDGFHFTDWERNFLKTVRRKHGDTLEMTPEDRDTIKRLWTTLQTDRRTRPEEVAKRFGEKRARRRAPWDR